MFPPKDSECECVCAGLGGTARTIQDQRSELHMRKQIYAFQRQEIQAQWLGKQSFWSGGQGSCFSFMCSQEELKLILTVPQKATVTGDTGKWTQREEVGSLSTQSHISRWHLKASMRIWPLLDSCHLGGGHLCPHKVWQILLPAHLERSEGFLKEHREPQGNQGDVPFLTMCHGTERLGQWEVAPTIASDEEKWKEQERDTTKGEWAWKTSPRIRILHSSSDQWYTVHLQWFELKRRWRGSFRNGTSGSLVRREVVKKKFGCKCCHVLQALLTLHSKKKSRDLTLDCC